MLRKLSVSLLGVLLLAISAQAAQTPRTEQDVPIYSGAIRDNQAEAAAATDVEGFHDEIHGSSEQGEPLIRRSSSLRIYTVAAPAEEVLVFYLRQLGGSEGDPAILYDRPTAAGKVSPVYYNLGFIDFGMYERGDAARMKVELERTRKPLTPGQWVSGAGFHWQVGEANGDVSHFELQLQDDSFHTFDAKGNKRTQTSIVINKTTYMNAADARQALRMMDEGERREEGERAETIRRLTDAPLDPAAAGVAVYPGAKWDAETTRLLQQSMALNAGAYRSSDEPVAIIKFYEKQPGFKVVGTDENGGMLKRCREEYNELLKWTVSAGCDFDVTVQTPWLDMTTGRMNSDTLITLVLND
jgi:hypothetical protein